MAAVLALHNLPALALLLALGGAVLSDADRTRLQGELATRPRSLCSELRQLAPIAKSAFRTSNTALNLCDAA